jgi:hypothetical protein
MKEKTENPVVLPEQNMPSLSINLAPKDETPVVTTDKMISIYSEILDDIREDRKEVSEVFDIIKNMVMNEGDATHSTKEAMVNLLKLKHETSDKKTKVMELLMRVVLKDRSTFPGYLAAHQENKVIINSKPRNTRSLIEKIIEEEKKSTGRDKS